MRDEPIGIIDSGVGGLTVWKAITNELPRETTVYVGDCRNTPYGKKSTGEIYQRTRHMIDFLLRYRIKLLAVACNTITVTCLDRLRGDYQGLPIVGTVPVVKLAAAVSKTKRIGILSTSRTARSRYQKELIRKFASDCHVVNVGTDRLVPFIEEGKTSGVAIQSILRRVLGRFQENKIDTLALGCTHYPLLKREVDGILGDTVRFLDSGGAVARQLRRILQNNGNLSKRKYPVHRLYTTGEKKILEKILSRMDVIVDKMQYVIQSVGIEA